MKMSGGRVVCRSNKDLSFVSVSFDYSPLDDRHYNPKVCRFNFYCRQCNIHYQFPPVVRKILSKNIRSVCFLHLNELSKIFENNYLWFDSLIL